MQNHKIMPALWYHTQDGKMQNVINYYSKIFRDNFKADSAIPLGDTPSGYGEMGNIYFFNKPHFVISTAQEHHQFNDTFAIIIFCKNQEEIDMYWNYFTQEGKASMCGWCNDKFGLRWQIIPENIAELIKKPNASKIMSTQSKIIINEYL